MMGFAREINVYLMEFARKINVLFDSNPWLLTENISHVSWRLKGPKKKP